MGKGISGLLLAVVAVFLGSSVALARPAYNGSWSYTKGRSWPFISITAGSSGNVFLSYRDSDKVIQVREFTDGGSLTRSIWSNATDWQPRWYPHAIAATPSGSLFVTSPVGGSIDNPQASVQELSPTTGSVLHSFSLPLRYLITAVAQGRTGHIYLRLSAIDGGTGLIAIYREDGKLVTSWPIPRSSRLSETMAVDPLENVYVPIDPDSDGKDPLEIQKYSRSGVLLSTFGEGLIAVGGISVGPNNLLYVVNGDDEIGIYSTNGTLVGRVTRADVPPQIQDSFEPTEISASNDGRLYVDNVGAEPRVDVFSIDRATKLPPVVFGSRQICSPRGQKIILTLKGQSKMKKAVLLVDGRPVKTVFSGKAFHGSVTLSKLPKTNFDLTIELITKTGYAFSGRQRFKACQASKV